MDRQIIGLVQDESVITGIGDEVFGQAKSINIYPNPARDILNFQLIDFPLADYDWKIIDQRGISVSEGVLEFDPSGLYTVNTRDLKNGVYYVVIATDKKPLIYRKIAVMNRR